MKRTARCLTALLATALAGCGLIGGAVNTAVRTAVPLAGAKLAFACLPEGTLVDTPAGPRPVESLRPGELVTGHAGAPVRILQTHGYAEDPRTEFLAVSFDDGARVDLCGMHRIDGVRARDLAPGARVADRTVAAVDRYRGVVRSFDLLTEDRGYRIAGVPVDSMIDEMLTEAYGGAREE